MLTAGIPIVFSTGGNDIQLSFIAFYCSDCRAVCLKLTSSLSRASEGGGRVPRRVEDCDSDVIASSTSQLVDSVAVLISRELSTSPSLSIADSSSSSLLC